MDLNLVSEDVKKMLSSRNYAQAVHESIHFAVAAESLATQSGGFHPDGKGRPRGLLYFLCHPEAASPDFLKSLLKSCFTRPVKIGGCEIEFATGIHDASGKDLGEGALVLQYGDTESPYIIYGKRVRRSLEMLDFLTLLYGYDAFLQLVRSLVKAGPTQKTTGELSNTLNKRIYHYLGEELGVDAAQLLKKYRFIRGWLSARKGSSDRYIRLADLVNDETVFDFWQRQNSGADIAEDEAKKMDFKTFANVADSFGDFLVVQNANDRGGSVFLATELNPDTDSKNSSDYFDNFPADNRKSSEYSDNAVADEGIESIWVSVEYPEMMEALTRTQKTSIKAVNRKEHGRLLPVVSMGEAAQKLPLTTVRKVLIGRLQSRITEALRRKGEIEHLVNADGLEGYEIFIEDYTRLQEKLNNTLLALAHTLITVGDIHDARHGLSLLLDQYPDLKLSKSGFLRDDGKSNDPGNQASATADVFSGLKTEQLRNPALNAALRKAESAWKDNKREGFKESLHENDSRCQQFSSLADDLTRLGDQLAKLMGKLNTSLRHHGGVGAVSAADRVVVQKTFRNIYGESQ